MRKKDALGLKRKETEKGENHFAFPPSSQSTLCTFGALDCSAVAYRDAQRLIRLPLRLSLNKPGGKLVFPTRHTLNSAEEDDKILKGYDDSSSLD